MNKLYFIAAVLMVMTASVGLSQSVQVPEMEDLVKLTNGTEIRGTVLIVGLRRVVVLVDEQEMDILPSDVEYIQKVKVPGELSSYLTENVDGMLRIIGKGAAPSPASAPSAKKTPVVKKKPAARPGNKPPARGTKPGAGKTPAKKPGSTVDNRAVPKEVQNLILKYGGMKKIKELQKSGQFDKLLKNNADLMKNKEIDCRG